MMVPFPFDAIGHWLSVHKVEMTPEAYTDLAGMIEFYCDRAEGKSGVPLPKFMEIEI